MVDNTCEPADSITLYFRDGAVAEVTMGFIDRSGAGSPLQLWRHTLRTWTGSQLGPADSVRLSFNQSELEAYWRLDASKSRWTAKVRISAGGRW